MPQKETIKVVAAVIVRDGRYFCVQRCRSHKQYISERWEFPGGKVEQKESDHEALIRELQEELNWNVYVGKKIMTIEQEYPNEKIELSAYWCLAPTDDFRLLEHLDFKWLAPEELEQLKWTEADLHIVNFLAAKPNF